MTTPESFGEISLFYGDVATRLKDDPNASLRRLEDLCQEAPDEDHLLVLAVEMLDPLLDAHWDEIGQEFEARMQRSSALRRCWSYTMADLPKEAMNRLDALLKPGEDIGRESV